ncbi:ribonuclease Z, mitochondrial isoform X3 [Atheta coriaria]|uniref:ribonuclease Z, mitochondrial isoform X3 n=1 Tax=Dalotia coriaria TaxID=877792 RepID=UPI0031F40644
MLPTTLTVFRARTIVRSRITVSFPHYNLQSGYQTASKNMPKDPNHVADAQRQRQKIKERNNKYAPAKVTLQVLGTGAEGAPRSLYIFSDQSRYLFNCGEGTQRLAHEHKAKLAKLEHVFITQASWKNMGGLPGTALTIQDVGVPEITLHGPTGLEELFRATRRFVVMKNMRVKMAECQEGHDFEDNVMTVKYVPLLRVPTITEHDSLEVESEMDKVTQAGSSIATMSVGTTTRDSRKRRRSSSCASSLRTSSAYEDDTDYYSHETSGKRVVDTTVITESMKKVLLEQKKRGTVMCYVCRLKARPGTLNLGKCVQLNIPAGPKLGDLKNGKSITLSDGTVITPEQVCEPEEPGPIFIFVDVPTEEYLDALIASEAINQHKQLTAVEDNLAYLVVHFTPWDIVQHPRYQSWIDTFSPSTHHIFINEKNTCMGSIAVHRIQYKLNLLNKDFFPLLGDRGTERQLKSSSPAVKTDEDLTTETNFDYPNTSCGTTEHIIREKYASYIQPGTFYNFHLRPRTGKDSTSEIKLVPSEYIDETFALDGFCDEVQKLRIEILNKCKHMTIRPYPKILFLGTGSCIPNKTRNTSGIMLFTNEESNILIDCGEGTYGQTIRFFGDKRALKVVANTDAIYISHLHADHHIGLIGYLQGRRRARSLLGLPEKPCYLLAPKQIQSWLGFYDLCFEDICRDYQLVANGDLLLDNELIDAEEKADICKALHLTSVNTCMVKHCPNAFGVAFKHENGFKLTYSGDTMPSENLIQLGMDSDLLIHEATMEDELASEAVVKMHSTTSQAIRVGQRMNARNILLTHFSQRYAKLPRFNKNFAENVGIAFDNMMLAADELPLLPLLYPSLMIMFADHYEDMEFKAMKRAKREERKKSL